MTIVDYQATPDHTLRAQICHPAVPAPITIPPIPQQPFDQSVGVPSFPSNLLAQPGVHNGVSGIHPSYGCSSCVARQAGPMLNSRQPVQQLNNGFGLPKGPSGFGGPMQSGFPSVQPPVGSISTPFGGVQGPSFHSGIGAKTPSYDQSSMMPPVPPSMPRPTVNPPGVFNSTLPVNTNGFDWFDLNCCPKPLNPSGSYGRYPGSFGSKPMGNMPPQPAPFRSGLDLPLPTNPMITYPSQAMAPAYALNKPLAIPPPPTAPSATAVIPPIPASGQLVKPSDETELATPLGFLNISSAETTPATPPAPLVISSKALHDVYEDLNHLAVQIAPSVKPFDTTAVFLPQLVMKLLLPRPSEWGLSIRTHQCMSPYVMIIIITVSSGVSSKEESLSNNDFPLYEYSRHLNAVNYPVFVLSYIGDRPSEIPQRETIYGLGDVESEILRRKTTMIREKIAA